jgi:hypothetical protein
VVLNISVPLLKFRESRSVVDNCIVLSGSTAPKFISKIRTSLLNSSTVTVSHTAIGS